MDERIAQETVVAGGTTLILIWISSTMEFLNENHSAVIALTAVITGIVTIIAAIYRHKLNKRRIELYEQEVKAKVRRKEDK